ncbi:MAG: GTP-binding protein [Nitrospirota bacterium]|nr:GTP-binding protein [Nitrospirota bacterium]
MKRDPVSVIVLSGFFGVGKTSILNSLVRRRGTRRIAVIMNDLSGLGLDPQLLETDDAEQFQRGEALVELNHGCVGCSLRQHLIEAVSRLARDGRFDTILIECSGLTDPLLVANIFDGEDIEGRALARLAQLDHLVTVVDAVRFWQDFESGDNLHDRGVGRGVDDHRAVAELLADQVECSTTLVLNKTDLVTELARHRLEQFLRSLNPEAAIVSTVQGCLSIDQLEASATAYEEVRSPSPGWMQLLDERSPVTDGERGIQTFVYRAKRPFHPLRFWTLMQEEWPGVFRSKGYFWLASQPQTCYMWSQAGGTCLYERLGRWWVAIPDRHWPTEESALQALRTVWDLEFGDRRIELAFIGEALDRAALTMRLDACLLSRDELALDEELWCALRDPFKKPSWERRQARSSREKPSR